MAHDTNLLRRWRRFPRGKVSRIQHNVVVAQRVVFVETHGSGTDWEPRKARKDTKKFRMTGGRLVAEAVRLSCEMLTHSATHSSSAGGCDGSRGGRGGDIRVAEEPPLLDRVRHGGRNHLFPGWIPVANPGQDIAGKNTKDVGIET